jgi:hypothetical protein
VQRVFPNHCIVYAETPEDFKEHSVDDALAIISGKSSSFHSNPNHVIAASQAVKGSSTVEATFVPAAGSAGDVGAAANASPEVSAAPSSEFGAAIDSNSQTLTVSDSALHEALKCALIDSPEISHAADAPAVSDTLVVSAVSDSLTANAPAVSETHAADAPEVSDTPVVSAVSDTLVTNAPAVSDSLAADAPAVSDTLVVSAVSDSLVANAPAVSDTLVVSEIEQSGGYPSQST